MPPVSDLPGAARRSFPPALTIAGYTPNPTGPRPLGMGARVRDHGAGDRRTLRAAHQVAWRAKRFGPLRRIAAGPEWFVVRGDQWRARFVLECGHAIERGYRPEDGRFRCPGCRKDG